MTKTDILGANLATSLSASRFNSFSTGVISGGNTESDFDTTWRTAGTVSKLGADVISNTLNAAWTVTLRKGGVDGNNTFSITSSTTGFFEDASNTDSISDGNVLTVESDATAAGSGTGNAILRGLFERSSGNDQIQIANGSVFINSTRYAHPFGSYAVTESDFYYRPKFNGTWRDLHVNANTNAHSSTTTVTSRVNAADGNMTVSISASTTGNFEDTTNTDTISIDDEIDIEFDCPGSGFLTCDVVKTEFDAPTFIPYGSNNNTAMTNSLTRYMHVGGNNQAVLETAETDAEHTVKAQTFLMMDTYTPTNTLNGTTTVTFRKDSADGNQTVSITSSTTGYFTDASNTDVVTDGQTVNYKLVTAGSSGNSKVASIGLLGQKLQIARPDGDQSVGNWEDEGGATTNLYQSIDEVIPSDSDYVRSEQNPTTNSKYECTLGNVTDPSISTGHIVRYRYRKTDATATIDIIIRLKQGGTTIASNTHSGVSTTWTDGSFTLSGAEADSITDYTDLRIECDADVP